MIDILHADRAELFYRGEKNDVLANSLMFTEGLTINRQDNLRQQCLQIYSVADAKFYCFFEIVEM